MWGTIPEAAVMRRHDLGSAHRWRSSFARDLGVVTRIALSCSRLQTVGSASYCFHSRRGVYKAANDRPQEDSREWARRPLPSKAPHSYNSLRGARKAQKRRPYGDRKSARDRPPALRASSAQAGHPPRIPQEPPCERALSHRRNATPIRNEDRPIAGTQRSSALDPSPVSLLPAYCQQSRP